MADSNRIRIIVDNQNLDYKSAEDLGIAFNRVVKDFNRIDKSFGDFSYSFDLPITKNNSRIFNYANAHGRKDIFRPNQNLPCKVYNNDRLLLDGIISLQGVPRESFTCVFYSKLKEFSDALLTEDGDDKKLRDLQFDDISFDYEDTIISHINANYSNSDEALYQFPLTFYSTYFAPYPMYNGEIDFYGNSILTDQVYQNFYYAFNSRTGGEYNRFYHHQLPPAFYIVRVAEQIFSDAGWTLGGQFWEDDNIKKIVMLYAGNQDLYDQATGEVAGYGEVVLNPAKLLPDMRQKDFLKGLINMFNLYFTIDVGSKIIHFETWETWFGDAYNPYDITKKVDKSTVEFVYEENNNPSIGFQDAQNKNIMGDNQLTTGYTTVPDSMTWHKVANTNFDRFFNKIGTTGNISLPFAQPTVKRTYLWNDYNSAGTHTGAGATVVLTPLMSTQTTEDNDSKPFNKDSGHTTVFNTEDTIKFNGKPMLAYYLGQAEGDYQYINIYTGATINRVGIGVASPFQVSSYRAEIQDYLDNPDDLNSRKTIAASYLETGYNMLSATTTDFSLCFDDNGYFHNTLWTEFHNPLYHRLQTSEVLQAEMRMNEYDWQQMQINRPISYNNEVYHILEIKGYDPIKRTASVRLLKF